MNRKIKTGFGVLLLILLSLVSAKAQETIATITISGKSFPESFATGETVRIISLTFFINKDSISTLYSSELSSSGNTVLTYEISLDNPIIESKIRIYYIHHTWNIFGDHSSDNYRDYTMSQPGLSKDGVLEMQTFSAFDSLKMAVNWRLSYNIEISPFKPKVIVKTPQCYNSSFTLNLDPNNPSFYINPDVKYQWQFGKYTAELLYNPAFTYFKGNLARKLYDQCYNEAGTPCNRISSAISNTDYSFMKDYYSIYDDLISNKAIIARLLLDGILRQQYSFLTDLDRNFLNKNFINKVIAENVCPNPYISYTSVKNWLALGTSSNSNGSIEFFPKERLSELTGKTKIDFRVRAYKPAIISISDDNFGPFSDSPTVDIFPAPPTGSISYKKSCKDTATGEITISNISGIDPNNYYEYFINKPGDPNGKHDWFYGTSKIIKSLSPGSYTLYLQYGETSINICSSEYAFTIETLPELKFDVMSTDVSCPGVSDGSIRIQILEMVGDNQIETNGEKVNNTPDYTFRGLTAKDYLVKVSDFCIGKEINQKINDPLQVIIDAVTPSRPTCISNPNGKIEIHVSGGTSGLFDYQIRDDNNNVVFSDFGKGPVWTYNKLPGGNYFIDVRDNAKTQCAWITSEKQVLAPVQPLSLSVTKTDVLCYSQNTGEIVVTASGGSGFYMYNIDNQVFKTDPTFSSLVAGIYTVRVRNSDQACSDIVSEEVTVGANPKIDISLTPVDVKCFGEGNGQINTVVSGGTNSFQSYNWEKRENTGWVFYSSLKVSLTGLDPGDYRLKVTDSKNCSEYKETTIKEPEPLIISNAISHDVICLGEKGSIEIQTEGGNGGNSFSYYENGGIFYENKPSGYPLPTGIYKLKVTDLNGCEATYEADGVEKEVIITAPPATLGFTTARSYFNGYEVSCFGATTGKITIEATGGNGAGYSGYTYSLSRANIPDQTTGTFTNLKAGIYDVTVTDKRGCLSMKSVELSQPSQLTLSLLSVESVNCFGSATGKITVQADGGANPFYKYKFDGAESLSSGVFRDLYAGTYEIAVIDMNGCSQNLLATVNHKNQPIQTTIIPRDIRCFGENNGEISATITGGSGGFAMLWEKKVNGDWQSSVENVNNPEQLAPGNYRLKVTDSDNCSVKDSTTINEPDLLSINKINLHDIICYGETGNIEIEAEGGNDGYKYFYSEKDAVAYNEFTSVSPLTAGTYKLKVTDSKGCETAWPENVTITQPHEALGLTFFVKDYNGYNVSCFGNDNGLLAVTPSGGNGAGYSGFSYLLSGRPAQTDSVFASLTAGTYDISLTDGRGCKITKQVILTQAISELFLRASSIEQATCIDDANGRITLDAYGGTFPYTYSSGNSAFVSGNAFTNLKVSNYHFTVKDLNGCAQIFDTSIVNTVPKMEITGTISDAKCFGQNSGTINVNISGGALPFTYRWKEKLSVNPLIDNLYKGNYTVLVTDAAGCKAEQMFEIHEPALPLSVSAISQPACVLTPNGAIFPTAGGGTPPYLFAVDDQSRMYNTSLLPAYSGRHKVFAADANNCRTETEIIVNERNTMPFVNFMLATSRYERDTLVVIDVSVPKPDNVSWEFSPEATVIATNPFDAKIKYNVSGIYPVKMTGHFETCDYTIEKLLNIAPFDPQVTGKDKYLTGIEKVQITPNPNNGQFKVKVKLYTKQQIHIKVLDYYSKIWYSNRFPSGIEFEQDISIPEVLPGTYVLWIVSDNDSKALLFVISQ